MNNNAIIICGVALQYEDEFLMVQEAKKQCYGKWNFPAGHLDPNETLLEAAKREALEESGIEVELTGIAGILNDPSRSFVFIVFNAIPKNPKNLEIKIAEGEILDAKWFTLEEILQMREANELRAPYLANIAEKAAKEQNLPLNSIVLA